MFFKVLVSRGRKNFGTLSSDTGVKKDRVFFNRTGSDDLDGR